MARRRLWAKAYGRCAYCGRLTEKDSLRRGPDDRLYGPDCLRTMHAILVAREAG